MTSTSRAPAGNGIVTRDELVRRAHELQPLLRDYSAKADSQRDLPDAVVTALIDAGMFRMVVPKRLGGYEADLHTVTEVAEILGAGDASAAWVVCLGAVATSLAGRVSARAQDEIFGSDPDARIAGGSVPGTAVRVEGGVRITGRWSYASGSLHATWASIAAVVINEGGEVTEALMGFAHAPELSIEDTWHTVGMRGTGSNTWVADDIFIPDHRLLSLAAMTDDTWPAPTDEAIFDIPFVPVAVAMLLPSLLGCGRAALDLVIEKAPQKAKQHTVFSRQSDSVGVQIKLAEAALKLETARLHTFDIVDRLDALASGADLSYGDRARMRGQAGYAAQQVLMAIHELVNIHGAGGLAESSRLQQLWRDANTAARHAAIDALVGNEVYGKSLLSVEERISEMV
ncbi:acyl-CoA dehydrogenase family protein [Mycobacterium sp. URHB0021]